MKKTNFLCASVLGMLVTGALVGCGPTGAEDTYDAQGRLNLSLANLYFGAWNGGDAYTDYLQDKFQVSFSKISTYDENDWATKINSQVNGNNLSDVFHYDIESFNFGNYYIKWLEDEMIKPLPDDLTQWPHLKSMLENTTNIENLKVNGKLYGIPIAYNIKEPVKTFSNFTYIYRKDWAKAIDAQHANDNEWVPITKNDDIYTWDEFNRLLRAFKTLSTASNRISPLGDVKWGFPSVTNFYKEVPHCFIKNQDGSVGNAFISESYLEGLDATKEFITNGFYYYDQYAAQNNTLHDQYVADAIGVYYDNFSFTNYQTMRTNMKTGHKNDANFNLEDATAFIKIKGEDGKYAIEGTDNWFSMTMFNYDISDTKFHKILDIIDFLLSDEGAILATYGIEGYDYELVNDEIVLLSSGWEKDAITGEYITKQNGAKYLRYMATLGYDMKAKDPFTDQASYQIVNAWNQEMMQAYQDGDLRIIKEDDQVKWMSGEQKNRKTNGLLEGAKETVLKYCYNKSGITTQESYIADFTSNRSWKSVLDEINEKLGK